MNKRRKTTDKLIISVYQLFISSLFIFLREMVCQVGHALVQLASLRSSPPEFDTAAAAATAGGAAGGAVAGDAAHSQSRSSDSANGLAYSAPLPAEYVESLFDAYR